MYEKNRNDYDTINYIHRYFKKIIGFEHVKNIYTITKVYIKKECITFMTTYNRKM